MPDDLSPNPNWRDIAANGEPERWDFPMPPNRRGFHAYLSELNGARGTITRQTLAPRSYDNQGWQANQPRIAGATPHRTRSGTDVSDLPAPATPGVYAEPRASAGLMAGNYMTAWGLADERGRRTTISDWTPAEAAVAQGQGLRLYTPEGVRALAP